MLDTRSFIENELDAWGVPGCGVAAIADGKVALSDGFGLRDVGADLPVTPRTLFAIGSATKSFTATAVGTLVEDGLVEWDKPVRDYLPAFRLHDPVATERVTPRDLLCHRTGIPRHDFVWYGHPGRPRADLVERLRHLPPNKDLRQVLQYSNLGYVAAGHLVEVITGMNFDDYVSTRLLKPLGMEQSNLSVAVSEASQDFSKPHERRDGEVVATLPRDINAIAPAGGINSCVEDMLRWLHVNLDAHREVSDEVIAAETIRQMHRLQMVIEEDTSWPESTRFGYGLGWEVGQYRGHRIVEHQGGIDGFVTECMLVPHAGVGVVVLTNSMSVAGRVIGYRVVDELLGLEPIDWSSRLRQRYGAMLEGSEGERGTKPRVEGGRLLRPASEYAGDYEHPGYGTMSVSADDGQLTASFGILELELSHRHFDVFDLKFRAGLGGLQVLPLTFQTAAGGDVDAFTVPFEPAVAPIRFDRQPAA